MAAYTTILPPPQTADTLDAWGGLDALPWPLDAGIWLNAGLYGLTATEAGFSGSAPAACCRIRTGSHTGHATAGGYATGHAVLGLVLAATARMDGHQIGGVARAIPAAPASAHSAGNLAPLRLRQDDAATSATARAGFAVFRVRTGSPAAAAYSVQACVVYRLRPLAAPGTAHSTGNLLPGYKGWNWQPLNAWEGPASPAPDNPQPGEQPDLDAVWQRVVQWQ